MSSQFRFAAAVAALCALTGCYQDKQGAYKATTDAKGNIVAAPGTLSPVAQNADANAKKSPDKTTPPPSSQTKAAKLPTAGDLNIPFYPGATAPKNADGTEKMLPHEAGIDVVVLETTDSMEKVDAFYQSKLTGAQRFNQTNNGVQTIDYLATDKDSGRVRSVEIKPVNGKTQITLASANVAASSTKPDAPPPAPKMPPPLPDLSLPGDGKSGN